MRYLLIDCPETGSYVQANLLVQCTTLEIRGYFRPQRFHTGLRSVNRIYVCRGLSSATTVGCRCPGSFHHPLWHAVSSNLPSMSSTLAFRPSSVARTSQTRKSTTVKQRVPVFQRRAAVRVTAVQQQESNTETRTPDGSLSALQSLAKSCDRFKVKYENSLLSAGVGALMVTTYCVLNGQSPAEAAGITVCATLVALVLNELLFE